MQKKNSLCAEICSSRAAEEASEIFWIMSEFSHDLQIICHNSGISLGWPTFKGKQGSVRVCVRNNAPYGQKTSLRVGNNDAPISKTF